MLAPADMRGVGIVAELKMSKTTSMARGLLRFASGPIDGVRL